MAAKSQTLSHADPRPVHAQDNINERTNMEDLTDKIAELSLVVKKLDKSKKSDESSTTLLEEVTCSLCEKTNHCGNRGPTNPYRGKNCNYRGKMGHIEGHCWSEQGMHVTQMTKVDG